MEAVKTKEIRCPWCGSEMAPVFEEKKMLVNLRRRRTFFSTAMQCPECKAQGPEISLAGNLDWALEEAANAAREPQVAWKPYDKDGIVQAEKLEAMGVEECEELAHLWHEARKGKVSVWPVKPGEIYWKLMVFGANAYDDHEKYIGQRIQITLAQRIFRPGLPWGANCFTSREDAMAEAQRRWPGVQLEPEVSRADVRTTSGVEVRRPVETGDMHGETIVPDAHVGKSREELEGPEQPNE